MALIPRRYAGWAVVTGGSSGIGAAYAKRLVEEGIDVVLVARREAQLSQVRDSLAGGRGQVMTVSADLATANGRRRLEAAVADLDVGMLLACAGLSTWGAFIHSSLEEQAQLLQINVDGLLYLVHPFARRFVKRGGGAIVILSSLTAYLHTPMTANYAGSKAYALALGEALWYELRPHGVDVLVVAPGTTDTPMAHQHGVDWGALSMRMMSPLDIVDNSLPFLGKCPTVVPGVRNKFITASFRFMTRKLGLRMAGRAARKATPRHLLEGELVPSDSPLK